MYLVVYNNRREKKEKESRCAKGLLLVQQQKIYINGPAHLLNTSTPTQDIIHI